MRVRVPEYTRFPETTMSYWSHAARVVDDAAAGDFCLALSPEAVGRLSFNLMESCGIVVGIEATSTFAFLQLENRAKDPLHDYKIAAMDLYRVEQYLGFKIIGIWHTHPPESERGPIPSTTDLDYAPVGLRQFLIFRGAIREFDLEGREVGAWRTSRAEAV